MNFQNRFQNFDLEYFQSQFERTVEINLADSSVQCANVSDLLTGEDPTPLLELPLYYPEVNGISLCCANELRRCIPMRPLKTFWLRLVRRRLTGWFAVRCWSRVMR